MVSEMLEQIRNQQEYIDAINDDREALTEQKSLVNKLYQMEIDRLRYMVASYLRTRLHKVLSLHKPPTSWIDYLRMRCFRHLVL